jgi:hypothetical protein
MDIADYRREAARIQKRRSVALGSREDVPTPQKGQAGPLEHPRLGLVGWIAYWSLGNCALAVKIIVGLIRKLNLTESVSEALTPIATKREVETNAKIVMLMKAGLAETKHCRTEQQRQEFHIGLSYVMPPRDEARSKDVMIRRICEQLDVRRGKRLDGRQFAADQAVNHRAEFETVLQLQKLPMKVGDIVLSHGNLCVLKSIGENDNCGAEGPSCVLTFSAGDITQEYSYRCMFGKGDGSARLQRPPPTLMPPRRIISKNAVTAQTRKLVKVHAYEVCPESPCKRDEMRKHVGPMCGKSNRL